MAETNTLQNIRIISAGAGSGKTYRLTEEMVALLQSGVRANGIIATTFTKKAAAELQERVRVRLLQLQLAAEADQLTNAMIGTVHSLGVQLLKRFAFEAGVSPQVDIIADEDHQILFNQSLTTVLTLERIAEMESLSTRLGLNKRGPYDWRKEVKLVTDIARANDFSTEVLAASKEKSFDAFKAFLGAPSKDNLTIFTERLKDSLSTTIAILEANEDATKVTEKGVESLKKAQRKLTLNGQLEWYEWVRLSKTKVGAKSKESIENLQELAKTHDSCVDFHNDIRQFIYNVFDISIEAIEEYDAYKKRRGLIDYVDMELHVKRLLDNPQVQQVMKEELDLLMVDEFQDTSPIQLEIFLKLSRFAKYSIWVGDPKQSIYGFRGADPSLMKAIIDQTGGVKPADIQRFSWRSRTDLVHTANAIFTKAFSDLPPDQVALSAKRTEDTLKEKVKNQQDLEYLKSPLHHWHFEYEGKGRSPGKPWLENCIASAIQELLSSGILIFPKDEPVPRLAQPGDVAVLCRSNANCTVMAEALYRTGIKAAISRNGLLEMAESKLILACLKFIASKNDALSTAEILKLASGQSLQDILENRLTFLKQVAEAETQERRWGLDDSYIQQLIELREQVKELSSSEIINLILEELDLRRIIASWGNKDRRLANVDELRKLALKYEEACNRLHSAATLGGFLLWLQTLNLEKKDFQSSGESMDAVNVMTYHKSKGLEWPIVICHSLEGVLQDKVWGIEIIPESTEVDLNNVLGNRWLRYWVNPYADQIKGTNLEENLNNSPVKTKVRLAALQEEARVMYVGITRARDYLIFPTRAVSTKWLNRVCFEGDENIPTLDHHTTESIWDWENDILYKNTSTLPFPKDFTVTEPLERKIDFIAKRNGKSIHLPYVIDTEREYFSKELSPKSVKVFQYGTAIEPMNEGNTYVLSKAIKAFIAADSLTMDVMDRFDLAEELLERYGVDELLNFRTLVQHSKNYLKFLEQTFQPLQTYGRYPIYHHHQDRLFNENIDLILKTNQGMVLIQDSDFIGESKVWKIKALALSTWLYLATEGIAKIFKEQRIRCFVNYFMGGGMVEIELNKKK